MLAIERQLAAERIRAEVMAMRSSDDLLNVVAKGWRQVLTLSIETPGVNVQFIDEETGYTYNYCAANNELSLKWSNPRVIDQDTIATCEVLTIDELSTLSTHDPVRLWRISEVWSFEADSDYLRYPGHWTVTNVSFRFDYVGFRERTYSTKHVEVIQELAHALELGIPVSSTSSYWRSKTSRSRKLTALSLTFQPVCPTTFARR